jgi:sulfide:quinone oxidoreductase
MTSSNSDSFNVLIAGGGVAALEAALALRELAGDRVHTTLLAPEAEFVYRPMKVLEPFVAFSDARRYSLEAIARDIGAELRRDAFKRLEPDRRVVHSELGVQLEYDAVLLALGAIARPRFEYALTLDDHGLGEQLQGLIEALERGRIHRLAFVIPGPRSWPLPIYELALLTARRAYETGTEVSITLVTPEDAPLAIFGTQASDAVERLLDEHHIRTITSAYCETPRPGLLSIHPGARELRVDRIVALPELFGPDTPGVPKSVADGFISVDAFGRVPSVERVFAAGDITDFRVKHGGIAAQQADAAAEAISALAGAPVEPRPFAPVIHGILLGRTKPLYLSAQVIGGHWSTTDVGDTSTSSLTTKIAAKYLAPYLSTHDRVGGSAT